MPKLDAKQLRDLKEEAVLPTIPRFPIYLILDNIYDTYNIGGLFRLADSIAAEKIYLCGATETPPNHKIKKASVGTYKIVPWEWRESAVAAIDELRIKIISIEQHPRAIPYTKYHYPFPIAFVVGNETEGVSKEALKASDVIVSIPMHGINKSLNVIAAAAIVTFHTLSLHSSGARRHSIARHKI